MDTATISTMIEDSAWLHLQIRRRDRIISQIEVFSLAPIELRQEYQPLHLETGVKSRLGVFAWLQTLLSASRWTTYSMTATPRQHRQRRANDRTLGQEKTFLRNHHRPVEHPKEHQLQTTSKLSQKECTSCLSTTQQPPPEKSQEATPLTSCLFLE